ncbi:superoxide dismutase [Flavobacterium jejuense]|uniref:Superoxide dismutase n=1 Tax=Flavobacterium jejuense TaxID=1544455 RepID=A0ABX0IMY1_9FLAO|nr:superoxide dismutase [Flavobacterium jejuense]NHN25157.1 superoxide dismutase [Flavobacterium jejuense]
MKLYSFFIVFILFASCKDKSDLVEVQIPEPEEPISVLYGNPKEVKANKGAFQLFVLNYPYDALKSTIDGKTMELHYSKYYLGYTNTLNKEIANKKEWQDKSIEDILTKVSDIEPELKNSAGGYYNHSLFFEILTPKGAKKPNEKLLESINTNFVSFSIFKSKFIAEANNHIGSGWIWLVVTKVGELKIVTTNNQDNPLMLNSKVKGTPILGVDLWEHAYYLAYQNDRKEYLENVFDSINWTIVSKKYEDLSFSIP